MAFEEDKATVRARLGDDLFEIIHGVIVLTVQEITPPGHRREGQAKIYQILAENIRKKTM